MVGVVQIKQEKRIEKVVHKHMVLVWNSLFHLICAALFFFLSLQLFFLVTNRERNLS